MLACREFGYAFAFDDAVFVPTVLSDAWYGDWFDECGKYTIVSE